jgi:UDP-N-acetylglucosamine 2-epimerase (non-hydrolysing)
MKILLIFGTRPEAIKMAPLVKQLRASSLLEVKVCVTGQHREMLDQVLNLFEIKPDFDLNIMQHGQGLIEMLAGIEKGVGIVLDEYKPEWVLVHGDTSSAMAASIACYYKRIKIGHIEAGLRTNNIFSPWPEEGNRQIIGRLASVHFAPTSTARDNLLSEGVNPCSIFVTGNTVIDALIMISKSIDENPELNQNLFKKFQIIESDKKLILVTGHRRESFGEGFESICNAIKQISMWPGVQIIYPVHLNPQVQEPVNRILGDQRNIHLIPPQEYLDFLYLMKRSFLILTDSGGIQEEAPSLGKPVLVMREQTERTEAVSAGNVRLVGSSCERIVSETLKILMSQKEYDAMSQAKNPYGDGTASLVIKKHFENLL